MTNRIKYSIVLFCAGDALGLFALTSLAMKRGGQEMWLPRGRLGNVSENLVASWEASMGSQIYVPKN